jgi:hypothetical protein
MTVYAHTVLNGAWEHGQFKYNGKADTATGVCSRNFDLECECLNEDGIPSNAFWRCAVERDLINKVKQIKEDTGMDVALQGELMGPGVQNNRENMVALDFFCFDIFDITAQEYLLPARRRQLCEQYGIVQVPHIRDVNLADICLTDDHIMHLLKFADRPSYNQDIVAEGVVFKSLTRNFSFKVINNNFLLSEKDE